MIIDNLQFKLHCCLNKYALLIITKIYQNVDILCEHKIDNINRLIPYLNTVGTKKVNNLCLVSTNIMLPSYHSFGFDQIIYLLGKQYFLR